MRSEEEKDAEGDAEDVEGKRRKWKWKRCTKYR